MSLKSCLTLLLLTFIIASSQEWFPFLWSKIQSQQDVIYIGKLQTYEHPCQSDYPNLQCRGGYIVPNSFLKSSDGSLMETLGLGFFLTDFSIECDGKVVYQSFSGKGFSLSFDSYKIYKTVNLKDLSCDKSDNVIVWAYTSPAIKTYGQISSNALAGNREFISSAKRAIEFLATGIYLVSAILLWFAWMSEFVILKGFRSQYRSESSQVSAEWGWPILIWAAFSIFKSGLTDILSSTPSSIDVLFRIQTALSLVAHTQPAIWSFFTIRKNRYLGLLIIILTFIPFSISTHFNSYLIFTTLCLNVVAIVLACVRKKLFQFVFSSLVVIEVLKVLNWKLLPPGSVTIIFMTIYFFSDSLKFMRAAGVYASANLWFRKYSKNIQSHQDLLAIFQSAAVEMNIGRLTVFFLGKNDDHTLWTYDDRNTSSLEITHLNYVPGSLAQVLSTDSPIMHLLAESDFSRNLLKQNPKQEFGDFFSILPLKSHGRVVGCLAVSRYGHTEEELELLQKERIEAYLSVFSECIAVASQTIEKSTEDHFLQQFTSIIQELKLAALPDISAYSDSFLKLVKERLGWNGFFGLFDRHESELNIVSSTYDDDKGGLFLKGQHWEMLKENVRAPAPVALFYGKTVYVPNVSWLKENISAATEVLFEKTKMGCFVAIPIRRRDGNDLLPIALLWLSSTEIGKIDTSFERCTLLIQESIEGQLQQFVNVSIGEKVFSDVIRPDIRSRLLVGEAPVERATGTLVMVDVVGSSAISKSLGGDRWKKYQHEFVEMCRAFIQEPELRPELFVWDALYLSLDSVAMSEESIFSYASSVIGGVIQLNKKFNVTSLIGDPAKCVRVCAAYGDTSREVSNGAWSIVGHAMARVCKLEQEIKPLDVSVAVTEELVRAWGLDHLKYFSLSKSKFNICAAYVGVKRFQIAI